VQADTLFAIASNTKAFTATSLNLLAEDGKLKMDDKVIDHLPSFRMSDPFVTGQMTIRDLLSHRSGLSLGAGDLLFWPTTSYSNAEVVAAAGQGAAEGRFPRKLCLRQHPVRGRPAGDRARLGRELPAVPADPHLRQGGHGRHALQRRPPEAGDTAAVGHAKYDFRTCAPSHR
jgi:CubicO group peptidase (beta-lactamase class C family)